MQTLIGF